MTTAEDLLNKKGITIEILKDALIQHFEDDKKFQDEFRTFMLELKPYLQGVAGVGLLWKLAVAVGGLLVIWAEVKGLFGR